LPPTDEASESATLSAKTAHSLRNMATRRVALSGSMTCSAD
jgi:hypothetical protein